MSDLSVAGVDSKDGGGTVLQHAVGEAAGGGADVRTGEAIDGDGEGLEGVFEFEAATADVTKVTTEKADDGIRSDRCSGLVDFLLVDEDATGEDEGLRTLAAGDQCAVDEELV